MLQGYLAVIWRWLSEVFVKTLVVWCAVTLLAIAWARARRIRPDQAGLVSPRREALLSLLVMVVVLALLFPLNRLVAAAARSPPLQRLAVTAATQLLMCAPVLAVLIARCQGFETVGLSRRDLPTFVALGLVMALVTTALIAAISRLDPGPAAASTEPLTALRVIHLVVASTLSALAHEFIYRGYLQARWTAWAGGVAGLLLSSLIYSFWHAPAFWGQYNWITMLVQFVALFVFGLLLGLIRERTGSIIPGALFHAANDIAYTLW